MWAFLLSLQAAGMVIDYLGTKHEETIMNAGAKAEQAGIEANIEQTRLESEQASLKSMKALRQNIGTQLAVYAARGTSTTSGNAALFLNESLHNFNADERTRKINAMGKENQLRAGYAISRLQNMSETSKLWQGFASRTLNRFPTSLSGWQKAYSEVSEGFGLTKIK